MAKRPASTAPARPLDVRLSAPVALSLPQTLNVKLTQDPKPPLPFWQRRAAVVVGTFAIIVGALWFYFIFPRTDVPPQATAIASLAVGYVAPQYLSVDDPGTVQVTVVNTATVPLTVTVSLIFGPEAPVLAGEKGASAVVKDLAPGARATQPLTFTVSQRPPPGWVSFVVRAATPDGAQSDSPPATVVIVPFVRQLSLLVISGLTLLAGLGGLVWNFLLKRLLPEP